MLHYNLRLARERRGWTQGQLAEQVGASSLSVYRWECGLTVPNSYYRQKLDDIFGSKTSEMKSDVTSAPLLEGQQNTTRAIDATNTVESTFQAITAFVPVPPHPFIDRHDLLLAVQERILAGERPATTALYGLPGVGKSAISSIIAHAETIRTSFPDGILWASLGISPNIKALLGAWGVALGLELSELAQLATTDELARRLQASIGSRRFLFIIDNVWHIGQALPFKIGTQYCAHLLTTRSYQVAFQFAQSNAFHIPEMSLEASLDLLAACAPDLATQEPESLPQLAQIVGYLPLGLVIIGRYLQSQAITEQPRRVRVALEAIQDVTKRMRLIAPYTPVEVLPASLLSNQVSLEAVIAASESILPPYGRKMLSALSVFPAKPNSFAEEVALEVVGGSVETLDTLIDAGLVENASGGRYMLHQTIADFASLKPLPLNTTERFIKFFADYVVAHQSDIAAIELERINVLAAFQKAFHYGMQAAFGQGVKIFPELLVAHGS